MFPVAPVIYANSPCEEAIALHRRAFGARVGRLPRYADRDRSGWDAPLTKEREGHAYHPEAHIGNRRIATADSYAPRKGPILLPARCL